MKFKEEDILLPVEVAGVKFRNPFYVGSGPTTMTIEQLIRAEETGWGGASLKLTFDPPPYINRHPRYNYWEKDGIFSFTTEKRMVMDETCRLLEEARKKTNKLVLMSNFTYAGEKGVEGWVNMARKFEDSGAYINEINMCCPNMSYNVELSKGGHKGGPKTGASLGQQMDEVKAIVAAIKKATKIPLFVKLTPEGGHIANIARACYEAGADAVGTTANRLAIHHIDLDNPGKSRIRLQEQISMQCMCSSWIHPLGLRDVYEIRKLNGQRVTITGAGGVRDWQSAAEMFLCGANLIAICAETIISGFGFLPGLIVDLKKWLKKNNYESTGVLTNIVPPRITSAAEVTLYDGNARLKNNNLSAPCVYECPASVPAQGYISKIAEREFKEGFELLVSAGPLMSICAMVCHHPCENACTRGKKDEPLRIRELKRFLIEKGRKNKWFYPGNKAGKKNKSVAVIGAGPSGLTAAYLLAGNGYQVTVYESTEYAGGMLRWALPAFRFPRQVLDGEIEMVKAAGVRFEFNKKLGRDIFLNQLAKEYDAVYVAIGAGKGMAAGIKGEKADGVVTALDFLKSIAEGNKPKLSNRKVAVIGGGFTAVDSARSAVRLGADKVYILYRRTKDEMPASKEEIREAEEEGVKIMYLVMPEEIKTNNNKVKSIIMVNQVLAGADNSGRRSPEPVSGTQFELKVDMVITALGQEVDFGRDRALKKSTSGTIAVDKTGFTGIKNVYAGGDAVSGAGTVIEAIAAAKNAAAVIDKTLSQKRGLLKPVAEKIQVNVEDVLARAGNLYRKWRVPLILEKAEKRKKNFGTYIPVLTDKQAVEEASRCLRCGCGEGCMICHDICKMFAYAKDGWKVVLNEDKCVGCGICVWRCPNKNIKMIKKSEKPI